MQLLDKEVNDREGDGRSGLHGAVVVTDWIGGVAAATGDTVLMLGKMWAVVVLSGDGGSFVVGMFGFAGGGGVAQVVVRPA